MPGEICCTLHGVQDVAGLWPSAPLWHAVGMLACAGSVDSGMYGNADWTTPGSAAGGRTCEKKDRAHAEAVLHSWLGQIRGRQPVWPHVGHLKLSSSCERFAALCYNFSSMQGQGMPIGKVPAVLLADIGQQQVWDYAAAREGRVPIAEGRWLR